MQWTDQRVDEVIGQLLRWGVIIAATVVATGGLWYLVQSGERRPEYAHFHGESAELTSVGAVASGAVHGHVEAVIQFGLLLLIATPVARVAFSVFAFAAQRDRVYVGITLLVLGILLYSLLGGTP